MERSNTKNPVLVIALVLLLLSGSAILAVVRAGPEEVVQAGVTSAFLPTDGPPRRGDEELAYLLVKLELRTRAVIGGHYARQQSSLPPVDILYKRSLTKNRILPAAVADAVFAEVVPRATGGRAWVKMVVDEPRNPNNRGDEVAKELMARVKDGARFAESRADGAYYYAEPIRTNALCLRCHGEPAGDPDPSFPEFTKDGWKEDQVIGAVVARVAPSPE